MYWVVKETRLCYGGGLKMILIPGICMSWCPTRQETRKSSVENVVWSWQYGLEIHLQKNGSCVSSKLYIKIEDRRAKRQPWGLNIFRIQEETEEPVEGAEKVIGRVEILTSIKHEPAHLAGISTLSFPITKTKTKCSFWKCVINYKTLPMCIGCISNVWFIGTKETTKDSESP